MILSEYKAILKDFSNYYSSKSIAPSELYAFYLFSKPFKLKRIVESGTYRGFSAYRLRLLYPECEIISYDKSVKWFRKTSKKYADCGIRFINGKLWYDDKMIDENTAVLIDGPKGKKACRLAWKLLKRCAFCAIHDTFGCMPYVKERFPFVLHTGAPTDELRKLDGAWEDIEQNGYYGGPLSIVMGKDYLDKAPWLAKNDFCEGVVLKHE